MVGEEQTKPNNSDEAETPFQNVCSDINEILFQYLVGIVLR